MKKIFLGLLITPCVAHSSAALPQKKEAPKWSRASVLNKPYVLPSTAVLIERLKKSNNDVIKKFIINKDALEPIAGKKITPTSAFIHIHKVLPQPIDQTAVEEILIAVLDDYKDVINELRRSEIIAAEKQNTPSSSSTQDLP